MHSLCKLREEGDVSLFLSALQDFPLFSNSKQLCVSICTRRKNTVVKREQYNEVLFLLILLFSVAKNTLKTR
jgi:hypothetical protein